LLDSFDGVTIPDLTPNGKLLLEATNVVYHQKKKNDEKKIQQTFNFN